MSNQKIIYPDAEILYVHRHSIAPGRMYPDGGWFFSDDEERLLTVSADGMTLDRKRRKGPFPPELPVVWTRWKYFKRIEP